MCSMFSFVYLWMRREPTRKRCSHSVSHYMAEQFQVIFRLQLYFCVGLWYALFNFCLLVLSMGRLQQYQQRKVMNVTFSTQLPMYVCHRNLVSLLPSCQVFCSIFFFFAAGRQADLIDPRCPVKLASPHLLLA